MQVERQNEKCKKRPRGLLLA